MDLHIMVCLDRDRGAICCCSGGARLPRGLAAGAGTGGIGGGEDGGAVGGAPRSAPRRTVVFGMPPAPDPDAEARASCGRSYPPPPRSRTRSRAPVCGGNRCGDGDRETSCPSPVLLDWACKELKKNIYMCGFFGQGSESLLVFRPLRSLGITQHTVKENICAEPCVCV